MTPSTHGRMRRKDPERDRIAHEVAAFLANGGRVEPLPTTRHHRPMTFRDGNVAMGSKSAARAAAAEPTPRPHRRPSHVRRA